MKRVTLVIVVAVVVIVGVVLVGAKGVFMLDERPTAPAVEPQAEEDAAMANPLDPANLFLATASESAARASKVLPNGPSEDARHVLGPPPAPTTGSGDLGSARVRANEPAAVAEGRARELDRIVDELEEHRETTITLLAPEGRPFEGRALWDALCSLGLEWGDGDYFHWLNPSDEVGGDSFFSVATNSEPGYFFPEEAAAGRMRVGDLVFIIDVPRTHDPVAVLAAMIRGAKYVQQRLGGSLVSGSEDRPLDEPAARAEIERVVQRMNAAGLTPGSHDALMIF